MSGEGREQSSCRAPGGAGDPQSPAQGLSTSGSELCALLGSFTSSSTPTALAASTPPKNRWLQKLGPDRCVALFQHLGRAWGIPELCWVMPVLVNKVPVTACPP